MIYKHSIHRLSMIIITYQYHVKKLTDNVIQDSRVVLDYNIWVSLIQCTRFFYKHEAYKHEKAEIFWDNNGKNNGLLFENKRKLSMI